MDTLKARRLLVVLLILMSCTPLAAPHRQEAAQAAGLVDLAKGDLSARLGIQATQIVVQHVEPWAFPCPDPETCEARHQAEPPGYVIRLAVGGAVYEYHGKIVGDTYLLWHEV